MKKGQPEEKKEPAEAAWRNTSLPLPMRVEAWLSSTGFPLEYQAGGVLADAEFAVRQGSYVPGEHNYNGIEIDVLASRTTPRARFTVIAECKVIPAGNFWVAMTEGQPGQPWNSTGLGRSRLARELEADHPGSFRDTDPVFSQPTAVQLKAMATRTKTTGPQEPRNADGSLEDSDPAYRAVQGLVGRVISHLRTEEQRWESSDAEETAELVVPMLIVDGALAAASWDSRARKFSATPLDFVWLTWTGHARWPLPQASILVSRIEALPTLANRLLLWSKKWCPAIASATGKAKSEEQEHQRELETIRNRHRLPDDM